MLLIIKMLLIKKIIEVCVRVHFVISSASGAGRQVGLFLKALTAATGHQVHRRKNKIKLKLTILMTVDPAALEQATVRGDVEFLNRTLTLAPHPQNSDGVSAAVRNAVMSGNIAELVSSLRETDACSSY